MNNFVNDIERQKLRAISVNNKPQKHKPQDIATALDIVKTLEAEHFDHSIQRQHLIQALEYHLVNSGNVSDASALPGSTQSI